MKFLTNYYIVSVKPQLSPTLCPKLCSFYSLQNSLTTFSTLFRGFIKLTVELLTFVFFLSAGEKLPFKDRECSPPLSPTVIYYQLPILFSTNNYRLELAFSLLPSKSTKSLLVHITIQFYGLDYPLPKIKKNFLCVEIV